MESHKKTCYSMRAGRAEWPEPRAIGPSMRGKKFNGASASASAAKTTALRLEVDFAEAPCGIQGWIVD